MKRGMRWLVGGLISSSLSGLAPPAGALAYTPFEPRERAAALPRYADTLRSDCARNRTGALCAGKADFSYFGPLAQTLAATPVDCDPAARTYRDALGDCLTTGDCKLGGSGTAGVAYDDSCLSSSLPWSGTDGRPRASQEPALFRQGGERAGVGGALNATVLIELVEKGRRGHHCGGLLRPGNRIITARHCFDNAYEISALKEDRAFVRILGRAGSEYLLSLAASVSEAGVPPVQTDWLSLSFKASDTIPAPDVEFRRVTEPVEAVVVGHYPHWARSRAGNAPNEEAWRQGLRWPGPRMCHAIHAVDVCLRLLCQTMPGYSGAPIFDAKSAPGQPLRVLGIVSREDTRNGNHKCGAHLPRATLATIISDTIGGASK